jgi:hypothetical protein
MGVEQWDEVATDQRSRDGRREDSGARPAKFGRRYGKRPQRQNGMHRRRRKKIRW